MIENIQNFNIFRKLAEPGLHLMKLKLGRLNKIFSLHFSLHINEVSKITSHEIKTYS